MDEGDNWLKICAFRPLAGPRARNSCLLRKKQAPYPFSYPTLGLYGFSTGGQKFVPAGAAVLGKEIEARMLTAPPHPATESARSACDHR